MTENNDKIRSTSKISGHGTGTSDSVISVDDVAREAGKIAAKGPSHEDLSKLGGKDPCLIIDELCAGYGKMEILHGFNLRVSRGQSLCLIGPNGAGKSTLFKMILKQEEPDSGTLRVGETVKIGYVDQSRDKLDPNKNVWEEISGGTDVIDLGGVEVMSRAYVGAFNFKGTDQQKKVGLPSGGARNRVHPATMLKGSHNLLLLDEPTNDLHVETLQALEEGLDNFPGCAVIISHGRWFLDRMATHILAFEGDSHVEWFEGDFSSYLEDKKRRLGEDAVNPKRLKLKKFAR